MQSNLDSSLTIPPGFPSTTLMSILWRLCMFGPLLTWIIVEVVRSQMSPEASEELAKWNQGKLIWALVWVAGCFYLEHLHTKRKGRQNSSGPRGT